MIDYKWNELRHELDVYFYAEMGLDRDALHEVGNDLITIIRKHFEGEK